MLMFLIDSAFIYIANLLAYGKNRLLTGFPSLFSFLRLLSWGLRALDLGFFSFPFPLVDWIFPWLEKGGDGMGFGWKVSIVYILLNRFSCNYFLVCKLHILARLAQSRSVL